MKTQSPLLLAVLAAISSPAIAQSAFTKLAPTTSPAARSSHGMLLTDHDSKLLVFGGRLPFRAFSNETWTFDGTTWKQESPTTLPVGRQYPTMAYNLFSKKTLMFGGNSSASNAGYRGDTWVWDGTNWTQPSLTTSPPRREKSAMAFHLPTGKIILFGGVDANVRSANGQDYDDTWEWSGTAWKKLSPTTNPGSRFGHAMCFDKSNGQTIMVGGFGWKAAGGHKTYDDMWAWTGTDWKQLKPKTTPGFRTHASMHYDDSLRRVVLVGGQIAGNIVVQEVWEWDGADWAKRAGKNGPRVSSGGSAYSPKALATIQFGGATNHATTNKPDFDSPSSDTFSYTASAPATSKNFGTGCVGTKTPSFGGTPPWLGETMTMQANNLPATGPATLILGVSNSAQSLAFMGFPQCTLYPAPLMQIPLVNSAGSATFTAPVPTTPSLNGFVFFTQVWSADTTGILMSNGVEARTGIR